MNSGDKGKKKEYIQHALALILCQKLDNITSEFEANIPKTFGQNIFEVLYCSVPPQTDDNMCGVIALMVIYQI